MDTILLIAVFIFFVGFLITQAKPWGNFVAIAGAVLFVVVYVLRLLGVAI